MPEPCAPPVMVSQGTVLLAVHAQSAGAVTVKLPGPPSLLMSAALGERSYVHAVADRPCCVMAWLWPPIVSEPAREVVPALAPTEYVTVPGPLPLAPAVIVIQPALVVTVHEHPAGAVTATLPVPPSLPSVRVAGEMLYEQTGVGSIGDACLLQLARVAETSVASEALMKNLEFTMSLRAKTVQSGDQC